MPPFDYGRFKTARLILGLKQSECATAAGLRQNDISRIESGTAKFVPVEYIQFLSMNGIDLNTLFNMSKEMPLVETDTIDKKPKLEKQNQNFKDQDHTPSWALGLVSKVESVVDEIATLRAELNEVKKRANRGTTKGSMAEVAM